MRKNARAFRECHSTFEASPFRQPEGRGFFLQPKHLHSASLHPGARRIEGAPPAQEQKATSGRARGTPLRGLMPAGGEAGKASGLEAKLPGGDLDDCGDVAGSETRCGDALIALVEHATEDRAFGDPGGLKPSLQGRDRTGNLASRDGHLAALALLIGLAAADRDQEAFGDVLYVGHSRRTHAPSSLQNIRPSSDGANLLSRTHNQRADRDGWVGLH